MLVKEATQFEQHARNRLMDQVVDPDRVMCGCLCLIPNQFDIRRQKKFYVVQVVLSKHGVMNVSLIDNKIRGCFNQYYLLNFKFKHLK